MLLVCITAAGTQASAERAHLTLWVKPKLCLRYKESQPCSVEVLLKWQAREAGNYCIYSALAEAEPLRCWPSHDGGEHEVELHISEDLQFWLSEPGSSVKLASELLELATLVSGGNKARSRRHIWNLI
nr:DUF3019 domain-containing protein [Agaribacterium haliotis]